MANTGKQAIDQELERLRAMLRTAEKPDPIDVATVEALASPDVRRLLEPILDDGAALKGVVLEPTGTMTGIVHLSFETEWPPGMSRATYAPQVQALVEVSPPRVFKASQVISPPHPPTIRFSPPVGMVPPSLQNLGIPSPSEAHAFNVEAARSFQAWASQVGMQRPVGSTGGVGLTTGTKCTSLLCFERSSDDFDFPTPSPAI
jgi:hypothetical protein